MLTIGDDIKLVILEHHNYHCSIDLNHSLDKTWIYFQSLSPELTKDALELIVNSSKIIRHNSVHQLNYYVVLEYVIKLYNSKTDLNDVLDLVTNLNNISPINQEKLVGAIERYDVTKYDVEKIDIPTQLKLIQQKNAYTAKDIYYLD